MANTEASGPAGTIRREALLLLATAGGPGIDPTIRELASGPIDWKLFLRLVATERAEAVVAARLRRLEIGLPEQIERQLRSMALRSDLRMATLSQRLDETLAALAAVDIPVLLLKGAALGRTLYGSLPRRPMLDIDLLIPAERVSEAWATAKTVGWVQGEFEGTDDYYREHFHLAPLVDGLGIGFNLELHTGLFLDGHPFTWPLEDLWARSSALAHSSGRVPSLEDLMLHALLHFSWSHMMRVGPWRTFRDVNLLASNKALDWEAFTRLATASGGAPAAYWTLRLARAFAGLEFPAKVEQALRPALAKPLSAMLERHFAGQWYLLDAPCPSVRLDRRLWRVAMGRLGRVRGRTMPWVRGAVFPDLSAPGNAETTPGKLVRHLISMGSYARYFRRVVLGAHPAPPLARGVQ